MGYSGYGTAGAVDQYKGPAGTGAVQPTGLGMVGVPSGLGAVGSNGSVPSLSNVGIANPGTNLLDQFTQLFNSAIGSPSQALSDDAISSIMQQLGFSNEQLGLNTTQAQQQADFAQRLLGLQNQGLGIQIGANERQAGLLPQLHDLTTQEFTAQEGSANRGADVSNRNLNSALTARGAYTSVMGNAQRGDIASQLQEQLGSISRQRQQSDLNYNEQVAQNKDARSQLGLMQQQMGISGEEITSRLNNALAQLGLSNRMNVAQLLTELGKVQRGETSPITQIMGDIYSLSGLQMAGGGGG